MSAVTIAAWGVFVAVPLYCAATHQRLHFEQWDAVFDELDAAQRSAYEAGDTDRREHLVGVMERMFGYFCGRREE